MSNNLTAYEQTQRRQTLSFILWAVLIASLALGILNIQFQSWKSVVALLGLAFLCIPLFWLNSRGNTHLVALLLSVIVLTVISANLFDGDGILDPGIIAYPIYILIGTLFFGKRAVPVFTLAASGSLALIVYLEINEIIRPTINPARFSDLIPIYILFSAAAAVTWVIVGNLEKNLQEVKKSEAELLKTYDLTLEAWAKVLEYHDKETEGHSRRAVELSVRLGHALGCSEEQIAHLRRGALLHDVGKLVLPDHILAKPGALDEKEMEIVQKHPGYARKFLDEIPFLKPSVDVAYSHHERWDGHGYPQGLKGEEIPLLARIFTIVDQWDALMIERVYRRAWTLEETVAYIKDNAGSIFDPHIAEVFLQIV